MIVRRTLALVALLACVAALAGCTTTKTLYEKKGLTVQLMSKRGDRVELNHPIIIAPVRLSHILARIDIRLSVKEGQQRAPAFHIEEIDRISEGLALGLKEAGKHQRVVVYSIRREKRFGIFDSNFLTSFIAYVHRNHLFLHLSRSDWEIPPRKKDRLPAPKIGKFPTKFRILPSRGMKMVDEQSLAINWEDDIFARPTRTRLSPTGKMIRKTILMEEPEPEPETEVEGAPPAPTLSIPSGVSPQTLRDLADLEDKRRRGEISEYEYERQRQKILEADPSNRPN